jgi:hypothetical protein
MARMRAGPPLTLQVREISNHHIPKHAPIMRPSPPFGQVAMEDRAERVPIGYAKKQNG